MAHLAGYVAAIVMAWGLVLAPPANAQQGEDADALNAQVNKLHGEGKYAQAIPLAQRLLSIREKALGPEHPDVATALGTLARLYHDDGRYAEAEPLYKRSLAIREHALGPDHADVAASLNSLAQLYQAEGRYADAEPFYKRSLAIREKVLGPDHPYVATTLNGLARLYHDDGRYADAEPLYKRSLSIREKALGPDNPDVAAVLGDLAQLYQAQGRSADAEPLYKRSIDIDEKALGPTHPNLAVDINNLAGLYHAQGRYSDAEPLCKRSLAIVEQAFGPDHPWVATALDSLANLYHSQGRYNEAEPLYKRSLSIREKVLGSDHTDVATSLNDLAALYQAQGRYGEAEPLYKRSLAISEKALGPNHPDLAASLNNLAELYRAQGRYGEAEPLYKRSLAISEKALGPDHPNVAVSLNTLAELYDTQGRYNEAEPLYKRSLAISEKALGPDHPNVAVTLNNLAELYRAQARYAEAEPLYKRSVAISEKALGPDHPNVADSVNNLASLYRAQGRYIEAEPLLKSAIAIREKALGADHPGLATTLDNLAELYRTSGRYAEAEPLYRRALAIDEKALGSEHPDVGLRLNNLALLYHAEGRYAEAESLYKRALAIDEKALGPDHPTLAHSLISLADLYRTQGRYDEAEPLLKRARAISEKALGPDHPDVGTDLNNLASLYDTEGRYAEAEPLKKRALAISEKALGPEHPDVATALNNLAVLYDTQGRYADAEPLYERALAIDEKALGPDHPRVSSALSNLASLYFDQRDWARAADFWRRGTGVIERRVARGTLVVGQAMTGKAKSEAEQNREQFLGLVKSVHRLARSPSPEQAAEMFETAQWAQSSEAASSLAEMAARGAKGDPKLSALVRERQDLVAEWQRRDGVRVAAVSQPPDKRDHAAETANANRLVAIDRSVAEIDQRLKTDFPDYAALASPAPLSVKQVQAELRPDEALVLFLDTPEWKATPEETFVWVVTKSEMRWLRSGIGSSALNRGVAGLRCGLDAAAWRVNGQMACADLLQLPVDQASPPANKVLPFDLAGAHALYKGLFGDIEDLVKNKHLLIVASGALTQLPFQVLVTALPNDNASGAQLHEVGLLGVDFKDLTSEERKSLNLAAERGVKISKVVPNGAAEAAGLKPDDLLLSIDGEDFASTQKVIHAIRTHAPTSKVQIHILRAGAELSVTATLGGKTLPVWVPRLLAEAEGKNVAWLARDHALTVLPAVSSLAALRRVARPSTATLPMIGFGDPLLDGNQKHPIYGEYYKKQAALARTNQSCPKETFGERVAALFGRDPIEPLATRGGLADVNLIRIQAPLPETAMELCDVAADLKADRKELRLGARATEHEVKALSASGALAKYRIVHFATHGALAGQLRGSTEPGLILTPPDTATEDDDGYLSASEIAGLKLDADWVILSACNTAGGEAGGDALSGLARAFFYAQARALLVSHWSVNSDATVKLITSAAGEITRDKTVGRAEALRRAMLAMIDTGKPEQAHPSYWAPFVVVGEGAAAR
jgi:tetratricopeptide (TPR) repeat protein/CHAT domain-containing protein